MRRIIYVLALLVVGALPLTACLVRTHPYGVHPVHHGRRCHTACGEWGYRQRCYRRCSIWTNGVCVVYQQACDQERFCVRHYTRCD